MKMGLVRPLRNLKPIRLLLKNPHLPVASILKLHIMRIHPRRQVTSV